MSTEVPLTQGSYGDGLSWSVHANGEQEKFLLKTNNHSPYLQSVPITSRLRMDSAGQAWRVWGVKEGESDTERGFVKHQ